MARRSYAQYCGLAKALDVVGERWTLLVVRNLLLGPLRYSELLRGLPGITTNLLAKRLREMEDHGLVERVRSASGDQAALAYRLTPLGRSLEPAIHALGRWGWHTMQAPGSKDRRNVEWLFVALRRRYRGPDALSGGALTAEIVADDVPYGFRLTSEGAEIARGAPAAPAELTVRGPAMSIASLFLGPKRAALPDDVEVTGPRARLRELLDAFERGE